MTEVTSEQPATHNQIHVLLLDVRILRWCVGLLCDLLCEEAAGEESLLHLHFVVREAIEVLKAAKFSSKRSRLG